MTPVAHFGFCGLHSSAPTTTSEPRGSQLTPERNPSYLDRKTPRRSESDPPPRSGPPSSTTRVGSPSVCESRTLTRLTFSDETMKGIVDYFEYKTSLKNIVTPLYLRVPANEFVQLRTQNHPQNDQIRTKHEHLTGPVERDSWRPLLSRIPLY